MKSILDKMNFGRSGKQGFLITLVIIVGVLLGALILLTGNTLQSHGTSHAGHSHDEADQVQEGDDAHGPEVQRVHEVAFTDAQIEAADIGLATVGPAGIQEVIQLPGEIVFNANRTAQLLPRFTGVVQDVQVDLGQEVKKGDVLAVLASPDLSERRSALRAARQRLALAQTTYERERMLWREKVSAEQDYLLARQQLQEAQISAADAQGQLEALGVGPGQPGSFNRLEVRAPFDGAVVERTIALGETVAADASIFKISDLSTVWADISVPAEALGSVRVGGKATVSAVAFAAETQGTVTYVGSLLGRKNRTATARVALSNPDGTWRPGLFIKVQIASSETDVSAAVEPAAIHVLEQEKVVFVRRGNAFVAQAVTIGRRDAKAVEIVKGLQVGDRYAVNNSFIIKSELGKSSASHSH